MVYVIRQLFKAYSTLFLEYKDQRTDDWLTVNTPFPMLIVIASYLYLSTNRGPKWMKNREPYNFKNVIAFYNLFQVVGNLFLVIYAWRWTYWYEDIHFNCSLVSPPSDLSHRGFMTVYGAYFYLILKLADLLDTAFFVLRKQTSHVSFLHVYHHSIMVMTAYGGTRFIPGGQATMLVIINCFVHVFMYAYYLGCSLNVSTEWVQWSKPYITRLQLVQFVLLTIHFFRSFIDKDCQYPKAISMILCIQNLFMMSMFLDFYRQTYIRQKFAKRKENEIKNK